MRSLVIISAILLTILSGCRYQGNGELVGVDRRPWTETDPYGMVFISGGSFSMGLHEQDVAYAMTAEPKNVSISPFWMDETEITNSKYRQFVYWVRDSLALTVLGKESKTGTDFGEVNPDTRRALQAVDFIKSDRDVSEVEKNYISVLYEGGEFDYDNYDNNNFLNWSSPLDYANLEIRAVLAKNEVPDNNNQSLFQVPPVELYRYNRQIDLNTDALYYTYIRTDLEQAAQKKAFRSGPNGVEEDVIRTFDREKDHGLRIGRHFNPKTGSYEGTIKDKSKLDEDEPWRDFATKEVVNYDGRSNAGRWGGRYSYTTIERVHIYPDTLCWMSDFTYSYNEPFTRYYFWHPSYDKYPVVGVNWIQAEAFCNWRTKIKNAYQRSIGEYDVHQYRLPTEAEWEYAARGGMPMLPYPWGGDYTSNVEGCYVANFKPMRGRYNVDGGSTTVMVGAYAPNEWGLYDMAGNVAEWTSNYFDESAAQFTHDLNPNLTYTAHPDDGMAMKRKVVRGGSWKDVALYMQNGVRTYEYQDTAKSYIGFRCVRSFLGRDIADGTSYSNVD
jgi:formylglycine-generating enzyme required for sulfatase activity